MTNKYTMYSKNLPKQGANLPPQVIKDWLEKLKPEPSELQTHKTTYCIPNLYDTIIGYEAKIEPKDCSIPFVIVKWWVELAGWVQNDKQAIAVENLIKAFPLWEKDVNYNCLVNFSWYYRNNYSLESQKHDQQ